MAASIRAMIERVQNGQLRIPAFQRGFVWDADKVAYLMDSILQEVSIRLPHYVADADAATFGEELGPFVLPDREPEFPVDYVLDGQQRLTSIFGVFQTEIAPDPEADTSWTSIYYDFESGGDLQESQFTALDPAEADPARYFPINTLFDVVAYREATRSLSEERAQEIDQVQATFNEASIPIQMIVTDDRGKVAIVFERVNRLGVELDTFQLLSAWTWSEEFDLQERFADLAEELQPFGFSEIGIDTNLLLRCCSAVVVKDVSAPSLLSLNGAEVRARFDEIENGLRGAIDFLRSNLRVEQLNNLPYPAVLVPLTVFFAAPDGREVRMSEQQRDELVTWFWRASFGRRFSGGVLRNLKRDLGEAHKLRVKGNQGLANIPAQIQPDWFLDNRFTIGAVNTKTFVLLLAQQGPRSFVSGTPVDLGEVLQNYNRTEFHHLFPRAVLQEQERSSGDINRLANFAFLSSAENKTLGGDAPSVYKSRMASEQLHDILQCGLIPESLFDDDYDSFLRDRAELLAVEAKRLAVID